MCANVINKMLPVKIGNHLYRVKWYDDFSVGLYCDETGKEDTLEIFEYFHLLDLSK